MSLLENRSKFLLIVISILIPVFLGIFGISFYADHVEKNFSDKTLGRQVVIGRDTLTIVNYSNDRKTFVMSNGVEISFAAFVNGTFKILPPADSTNHKYD